MMLNPVPSYCVSLELNFHHISADEDDRSSQSSRYTDYNNPDACKMDIEVSPQRWYALALFCAAAFIQNVMWNTWSPIAGSALCAYPSWQPSTVALLCNWGSITFLLFIVPSCWMLNKKGLRYSFIVAGILCTIASGIRCLRVNEEMFTILAHVGAILNAIAGVTLGPAVVLLSSTWFPPHQRTSATGIGTACSQLGVAASYLMGPLLVSEPPCCSPNLIPNSVRAKLRAEIINLMVISFVLELILLILMIATFPDRPKLPPSRSSCVSVSIHRPTFRESIGMLINNKDLWFLALAVSLTCGIAGPWFSLLTVTFSHFCIPQCETARLGFWTVISSCCLGLTASKLSDLGQNQLKTILLLLFAFADFMFCWILLITTGMVPFNKDWLIVVVIAGLSALWSTPALFYEFGVELTYPAPEGLVAGSIMSITNATACLVYLQLYIFPLHDVTWMTYALFFFGLAGFFCLCQVEEQYKRLELDTRFD